MIIRLHAGQWPGGAGHYHRHPLGMCLSEADSSLVDSARATRSGSVGITVSRSL